MALVQIIMLWLLFFDVLCQFMCTGLAVREMMLSWDDFYQILPALLQTQPLFDDVANLKFKIQMLRYLGVIFLLPASYVLMVYVIRKRKQYRGVKSLLLQSGLYIMLQLIGEVALGSRLVFLLMYSIKHKCDADGENLEPNYILLGIAAVFGLLSLFSYIGYLFTVMYEKLTTYEEDEKKRKRMCIKLNTCAVNTNTIDSSAEISVCDENINAVNGL